MISIFKRVRFGWMSPLTDAERSAPVKNSAAYRTVFLGDDEGRAAMAEPREFMGNAVNPCTFLFEVRWNSSGDYHSESRVISGSQGTRNQAGRDARFQAGLQSPVGSRGNQSGSPSSADRAHVSYDDCALYR